MAFVLDLHPGWREPGRLPVARDGNGDHYVLVTVGSLAEHVAFVDQSDYEGDGVCFDRRDRR